MREGEAEKTLVDKKPQGVWKQVKQYLEEHGTEQEQEAAKSWSVIKLYYKFGLSNLEVSTRRRCCYFALFALPHVRACAFTRPRLLSLFSLLSLHTHTHTHSLSLPPLPALPPPLHSLCA